MIHLLYSISHFFIRYSGLAYLFRHLFARNRISIVLYHNPKPDVFEKHLIYLSKRYHIISLSEYVKAMESGNFKSLPKYALIVTIDDGWKENYELLPVIKKFQFKPTIFLTSHIIDTERHFWWTVCSMSDINRLKTISNQDKLLELKEKYGHHYEKEYPGDRQALNMYELEEMKNHVEFGLHTCFHPVLTQCDYSEKRREIIECKNRVKEKLGVEINTFSYPNGDYDNECIDLLKECGVKVARTIDSGWNNRSSANQYKLKVTGVSDNGSTTKLATELTGIPMYMQYFFDGSSNGLKLQINN